MTACDGTGQKARKSPPWRRDSDALAGAGGKFCAPQNGMSSSSSAPFGARPLARAGPDSPP